MGTPRIGSWVVLLVVCQFGFTSCTNSSIAPSSASTSDSFSASTAGTARNVDRIPFRWCPAGHFRMGSPPDEPGRQDDKEAQVDVTLSKGFWIGQYEVTQGEWNRIVPDMPRTLIPRD